MSKTFTCLRCDKCCYFSSEVEAPIIFPYEREIIRNKAEELKIKDSITFKPYEVYRVNSDDEELYVVVAYKWLIKGYCPFYDRNSKLCRIHSIKPLSCKMYPLILNVTCNTIHVSEACNWVRENLDYVLSANPMNVFQEEIKALLEAYVLFLNYINTLKDRFSVVEKVHPQSIRLGRLMDIDKVIESRKRTNT